MKKLTNLVFSGGWFILFCYNCGRSHSQVLYIVSLLVASVQHAIYTIQALTKVFSWKLLMVPQYAYHSVKLCQLKIKNRGSLLVLSNDKACNFRWKALFSYWWCTFSFQHLLLPSQSKCKQYFKWQYKCIFKKYSKVCIWLQRSPGHTWAKTLIQKWESLVSIWLEHFF